jgi:hypothetical protein
MCGYTKGCFGYKRVVSKPKERPYSEKQTFEKRTLISQKQLANRLWRHTIRPECFKNLSHSTF